MRRVKNFLINISLSITVILLLFSALLVLDLYEHKKMAKYIGCNYRGYRGPIVGKKQKNEIRIVVLGGSCAFGYGVKQDETIPSYLGEILNKKYESQGVKVTVINLAYNNESTVSFMPTIKHYEYLEPDIVLAYSGYNDYSPEVSYYRTEKDTYINSSFIFRMTGYMPILPLVIREKYYKFRYGSIDKGYKIYKFTIEKKRPFYIDRVSKKVLREKGILSGKALEDAAIAQYIGYIDSVASLLINSDRGFIFVRQPTSNDSEFPMRQQQELKNFVCTKYRNNDEFLYIDFCNVFGRKTVDLPEDISYDGVHLTSKGNGMIAQEISERISKFLNKFINQKVK